MSCVRRPSELRRDRMIGYNFTDRVRKVLQMAREEAARLHHEYVGPSTSSWDSSGRRRRRHSGPHQPERRSRRHPAENRGDRQEGQGSRGCWSRPSVYLARQEGARAGHERGPRAQSLLRRHRAPAAGPAARGEGHAAQVLTDAGVNLEQSRAETLRLLGSDMPQPARPAAPAARDPTPESEKKSKTPALDHFCRDLTQLAAEGQLDPTIGRQGDPAGHGDPGAAQEEQSGADRRAGRRQDRHRRRPGAPDRHGRAPTCPGSRCSRSTWRRSSRAPSTAASSRSGSRRS